MHRPKPMALPIRLIHGATTSGGGSKVDEVAEVAEGVEGVEEIEGVVVVEGSKVGETEKALEQEVMGARNRGQRWAVQTTSRYVCVTVLRLLI